MKSLKKILESVSDNTRNKVLAPYRRKAKSGMTEDAASYVGLLEILLDELSDTSKMDDKTFKQKVERYGARSKLVSSFVKKEQLPLDQTEVEAEIEQQEPEGEPEAPEAPEAGEDAPMKSALPDEPDVTGLTAKSPGGLPPPLPKKGGKTISSPPPPAPSGEEDKPGMLPALSKLVKGAEKKKELALKAKPESGDNPQLKKLKGLLGKAVRKKILGAPKGGTYNLKKVAVATGPMQDWSVGQRVNVGIVKDLLITGGNSATGWLLAKGDRRYLFVPSKSPRADRGLYRIE